METNFDVTHDAGLRQAAERLIAAAEAYWTAYQRALGHNAVVWLTDTDGRLVIFTRSEYRQTLLANIDHVREEHRFAATPPAGDG